MQIIWDTPLVVLSVLFAVLGSFAAFAHGRHMLESSGRSAYSWMFAGASTLGLTIWAAHFIGILAFHLPVHVDYDPWLALLSVFPAVSSALLGFYVLRGSNIGVRNIMESGLLIGVGISLTQFACMATLKLSPPIIYGLPLIAASVALAVIPSCAALLIVYLNRTQAPSLPRFVLGAVLMGLAISAVHYTVVLGMHVPTDSISEFDILSEPRFMAMLVFLVSLFWSGGGILATLFDQRMARQNADALEKLRGAYDVLEERAQQLAEDRSRLVLDNALDAVINIDSAGLVIEWNAEAGRIFGYRHDEAIGQPLACLIIPPPLREAHSRGLKRFLETGEAHVLGKRIEITALRKDGTEFPVELTVTAVHRKDEIFFSAFVRDINERKLSEQKIHQLAFYDPLTKLPNRRLLLDRLQQAMAVSTRSGRHGALLFLDLDHFKTINDTQGHATGDLLLIEVARRLQTCVREGDSVARLGGDEFVVVLEELNHLVDEAATQTELVAEKIRNELDQPFMLKNYECHTSPSIGICLFRGHVEDVEEVLKHADVAMYQAKEAGRNSIRFFDPQMQTVLDMRAALEADLRQALIKHEFRLHYQVQVDSLRRPLGAEVLLRWEHPERGLVFPLKLISLAEETGLIVPIGLWVLETACAQLKAWQHDPLTRDLTLAVNVSAKQFHQADFVGQMQRILLDTGAKPSLLNLELTESMMLENVEDAIGKMRELKLLGVSFSMDDFGTGYSSLQYLKRLPLDRIKIDRSFVLDITSDPNDAAIVQTIIAMTEALGLDVIAEGVETKEQWDFLESHGCHVFQGYLFNKPAPLEQFESMLRHGNESRADADVFATANPTTAVSGSRQDMAAR